MAKKSKKAFSIDKTLQGIWSLPAKVHKSRKLQKNVAAYVLEGGRREQMQRLEEVAMLLEVECKRRRSVREGSNATLRTIARTMFKNGDISPFLDMYAEFVTSEASSQEAIQEMLITRGECTDEEIIRSAARSRFSALFLQVAGENLERSMQFALLLLEDLQRGMQHAVSGVIDISKFPTGSAAAVLLVESATSPPHEASPGAYWIHQLIKAAWDNPQVDMVLQCVLETLRYQHGGRLPVAIVPEGHGEQLVASLLSGGDPTAGAALVIPTSLREQLEQLVERKKTQDRELLERKGRIIEQFEGKQDEVERLLARRRQAIVEQPRRTLRPQGVDHIEISLAPLYNGGLRAIVFHPENNQFPDLDIRLLMQINTPHLISYPIRMENLQTEGLQGVIERLLAHPDAPAQPLIAIPHEELRQFDRLLEFVVIDILHRIIVEGKELQPTRKRSSRKGMGGRKRNKPVRGHLRRLQPGHRASDEAKEARREECGWENLPPGFTYVKTYWRGNRLTYDMPTEPVAVYSDADLYEGGGLHD